MNDQQKKAALLEVIRAVVDTVKECGASGAPGGVLYAALMSAGCNFSQYQSLMGMLVSTQILDKRGECYFPGKASRV